MMKFFIVPGLFYFMLHSREAKAFAFAVRIIYPARLV